MPVVDGEKYPYTKEGKAAAAKSGSQLDAQKSALKIQCALCCVFRFSIYFSLIFV